MARQKKRSQKGGGSNWAQSFYAYFMSPAELSRYTLKYIDKAPMFNPLEFNTVMPTGTSGIIPTGVYLANHPSEKIRSMDYNLKDTVCAETMSGGAPLPGSEKQKGGGEDYSFFHPSPYPSTPSSPNPQYIGVVCGESGKGCGMQGPGKFQPYETDKDGRLTRCKVYYSATSSYGPGCEVCQNGPKPAIWNAPGTKYGGESTGGGCDLMGPCGGCGSCPPCLQGATYQTAPGCAYGEEECRKVYNQLMSLDHERLWALCKDNYVKVYTIDKETGRITPRNKERLCRRLAKKLADGGRAGQVFLT